MEEQTKGTPILHNNTLGRVIALILALFFIVYTFFQTYRFLFESYSTESAYLFEVARVYTTHGLLVREEQVVPDSYDGAIRYVVPEGGKFIATTPVALRYSGEDAADIAQLTIYQQQQRDILQKAQDNARAHKQGNIAQLSERVHTTLRDHTGNTHLNEVSDTNQIRLRLLENITAIQAAVDNNISFAGKIEALDSSIAGAEQGTTVMIDGNGYFSRFSDGFEDKFIPEMIEDMTVAQLRDYLAADYPYNQQAFGKQITDYNWYYLTTIPTKEAEPFQPGTGITISFLGSDDTEPVSGWVESVTGDLATGESLLVIKSNDMTADTVSRRTATVKLGFEDYRGIRFSKKALRINDGVKGVYVKGKDSVKFKKVDVVYTGTDFYLSRLNYDSQTHLNIFDEIIVEGTGLYDGKPLE